MPTTPDWTNEKGEITPQGTTPLLPETNQQLANALREQEFEALRDAFDVLFGAKKLTAKYQAMLEKYNLTGLLLTQEEKLPNSDDKVKRLAQYCGDLAHVSFGVYSTLTPANVKIDLPETSGQYKFIFAVPGTILGDEFTLMAGTEEYHRQIFERYKSDRMTHKMKPFEKLLDKTDQVDIAGGGWIDLDVEKKYIKFHGSSGSYAFVADKIIWRATQSLRDQGRTTQIQMQY